MRPAVLPVAWRVAALAGLVGGLALAAPLEGGGAWAAGWPTEGADLGAGSSATTALGEPAGVAIVAALAVALVLVRPRRVGGGSRTWLALVIVVAVLAGLAIGSARLSAIDGGGLDAEP